MLNAQGLAIEALLCNCFDFLLDLLLVVLLGRLLAHSEQR